MRFFLSLILEAYAVALASMQSLGGVHTDEAKYLLNIPYPHPPLARWLLGLTDGWSHQEFFWRIVFASLCVQAVWLVWALTLGMPRRQRRYVALMWLCASALVLQAGTVMMAPLTALQGLVLLWLVSKIELKEEWAGWVGLFWLVSLFTAYQAILYLPLMVAIIKKVRIHRMAKFLYIVVPVLLLMLYTFTNPLALAAIMIKGDQGTHTTLVEKVAGFLQVWMLSGSLILSVMGTIGLARSRQWELILSFVLVSAYLFLARFDYNAILLLPLLVTGMLFYSRQWIFQVVLVIEIALSVVIVWRSIPALHPTPARAVMQVIADQHKLGDVLISGSFGHEWQYESSFPIYRYTQALVPHAQAIVCLDACIGVKIPPEWQSLGKTPMPVFERRK